MWRSSASSRKPFAATLRPLRQQARHRPAHRIARALRAPQRGGAPLGDCRIMNDASSSATVRVCVWGERQVQIVRVANSATQPDFGSFV